MDNELYDYTALPARPPRRWPGHRMISVAYSIEVNDMTMFAGAGMTGPDFQRTVTDQFDQLYGDSATSPRVLLVCLHPFLIEAPTARARATRRASQHVAHH